MKKTLNIGLLGFGAMGKVHTYCVKNLNFFYADLPFEARIKGVCTTTLEKSQKVAKEYGFDLAVTDEDALINDPEIDIIDICTPNIYHYETLKKAIAAGKHVYCEKPLCTTREQAEEIARLSRHTDKIHNIVFNNRHLSALLRAKELVDEGKIGRVLSFSVEYLHNSATDTEKSAGWKQDRDVCGGGVLFDLGSHCIDLVYYLCGEFESVMGMDQIAYPSRLGRDGKAWETNADEAFYMLCRMKCGARGTITVSKITNGSNDDLDLAVYGEKGSIKFSLMQPNFLYFYDASSKTPTLGGDCGYTAIECVGRYPAPGGIFPSPKAPVGWLRGHVNGMYSFLDSVHSGIQTSPDFSDAAHVQAVMEAGYRSAKEKKEITL